MSAPLVELAVRHRLGSFRLELELELAGPVVAILGASGSGKSSLLRLLAGLLRPEAATVRVAGVLYERTPGGPRLPPEARSVGCLFQDALLFPHRSVARNLTYGQRRGGGGITQARVIELLELGALLERAPATLSGGERQRVALGRALLSGPRLLLLDEPLAAVDADFKAQLLPELRRVRAELGLPMLLVTHGLAEAAQLADEVLVLEDGRRLLQGPAASLLGAPELGRVAAALDFDNSLAVVVESVDRRGGTALVRHGSCRFKVPAAGLAPGARVEVRIRAEEIILSLRDPHGTSLRNHLPGTVERLRQVGERVLVQVDCGPRLRAQITPEAAAELGLEPGRRVFCLFKSSSFHVLGMPAASAGTG